MNAYLLCAGFGTRMHPLTEETPKSLLHVAGRPLLDYLMEDLADWTELDSIHIAVNHQDAEAFRAWASNWRTEMNASMQIHDDGVTAPDEQLGAVGDLQFLLEQSGGADTAALVSGGDSLYRFPLSPILNAFDGSTNQLLALYEPNLDTLRQRSVLKLEGTRVTGLAENPADPPSHWTCPSWYLLTPAALSTVDAFLERGGDADTLGAFVDAVTRSQPVEAVRLPEQSGLRLHCNTPDDLRHARDLLANEPRLLLDAEEVNHSLKKRD